MAIRENVAFDVSHLPTCGFGNRDPLWWAIIPRDRHRNDWLCHYLGDISLLADAGRRRGLPGGWSAPDLMVGASALSPILATAWPMYLLDLESKGWTSSACAGY